MQVIKFKAKTDAEQELCVALRFVDGLTVYLKAIERFEQAQGEANMADLIKDEQRKEDELTSPFLSAL